MKDEWTQATRKLIEQTRNGQIHWHAEPKLAERRKLEVIGTPYLANVGGKTIAVYEHRKDREPHWTDNLGSPFIKPSSSSVQIEFVDENFNSEWVWPSPESRWELLEAVQYSASNADQFLEQFLATPSS